MTVQAFIPAIKFSETYKTAGVSTANMTLADNQTLDSLAKEEASMVATRPTGFFLKLFEEVEDNHYPQMSPALNDLIAAASQQGYRCIEFDCDADTAENAEEFEW